MRGKKDVKLTWGMMKEECLKFIEEVMEALHIPSSAYFIDENPRTKPFARIIFDSSAKEEKYRDMNEAIKYAYSQNYIRPAMVEVENFPNQIYTSKGQITHIRGASYDWFPLYLEWEKDINFFLFERNTTTQKQQEGSPYMIYKIIKLEPIKGDDYPLYYICVMNPNNTPTSVWCNIYRIKWGNVRRMWEAMAAGGVGKVDFPYTPLTLKGRPFINWGVAPWEEMK